MNTTVEKNNFDNFIIIRTPGMNDFNEFYELFSKPGNGPAPFVQPPLTENNFARYIESLDNIRKIGFFICFSDTKKIIGVVNIREIIKGYFRSAFLGFYLAKEFEGKGLMYAGLSEVMKYAFDTIDLHRLEANIQPDNIRSKSLVKKLGFKYEGFSEKYLKINGEWKDH